VKTVLAFVVFSCFNLDFKDELAIVRNLKIKASGVCLNSLDIFWF